MSPVLIAFPMVSPKPYYPKPVHVFTGSKKVRNGKLQITFSSQTAWVSIFEARSQFGETMVSVVFLLPVSDSVSGPIKNPQSGKIREDSGKISGKSNNYYKGQDQELKTTVIYIYIYIHICTST